MDQKENGAKAFFVFHFLNSNLVPVDSELNSALGNQSYFYQIYGHGTKKSSQTWKSGLKLKKYVTCDL